MPPVAAFQGAVVTPIAGPSTAVRTRPTIKKLLTAKALATLGAVTLVSAGAAAAATGTVPSPFASDRAEEVTAQHVPDIARDNVAEHTDVDAPPTTQAVTETTAAVSETTVAATAVTAAPVDEDDADESAAGEGTGPDATGPAQFGLCTAYAAHQKDAEGDGESPTTSTDLPAPFQNLTDAATAAGQTVEEFCAAATPGQSESAPGQTGVSPSATAPGQTGESPSATAPGRSGESPSATAPGQSGATPSATAPGKSGDSPSDTAPGHGDDKPSANGHP